MAVGDLTTLAAVRALLQDEGDEDGFSDELVNDHIAAASGQITHWTRREFAQPDVDPTEPRTSERDEETTRDFVSVHGLLDLDPYDARAITAVVDVTDGEPGSAVTSFRLRPRPARNGVYMWLEVPGLAADREIEITGRWGWPQVPATVRRWCGIVVVSWLRSDVAAFSTSFAIDEGRMQRPEDLPRAAKQALKQYKRRA